jgi:hypothetical protein
MFYNFGTGLYLRFVTALLSESNFIYGIGQFYLVTPIIIFSDKSFEEL